MNYPYLSDGMWFLTQHKRWGLLKDDPDYLAVAKKVNQLELYKQAATLAKAPVPKDPLRTAKLIDGVVWDGKEPEGVRGRIQDQSRGDLTETTMPSVTLTIISGDAPVLPARAAPARAAAAAAVPLSPAPAAPADHDAETIARPARRGRGQA